MLSKAEDQALEKIDARLAEAQAVLAEVRADVIEITRLLKLQLVKRGDDA